MLVRDLLEFHSFLKSADLIAGEQGLSNQISDITVMEAPDFPNWVNGGEFVLSTFFSVKENIQKQIEIIEQLSRHGVAALGIKTGRYIDRVDPNVIKAADKLGFPLFTLSKKTKFRHVIRLVSEQLIDRPEDHTQDIIQFHDKLMALAVKGQTDLLCEEIATQTGYPCAIYTENREKVSGQLQIDSNKEGIVTETAISNFVDNLMDEYAWNNQPKEYRKGSYVVVGCSVKEELTNILIFSDVDQWRYYESMLARVAANAISTCFLEDHVQRNVEKRMKSTFIEEVIGKGMHPDDLTTKADFFSWKLYDNYQVIVVRLTDTEGLTQEAFRLLAERWAYELNEVFPSLISMNRKDEFIGLLSLPHDSYFTRVSFHKKTMRDIVKKIFYHSPVKSKVKIGVGSIFDNSSQLKNSYRQARSLIESNVNSEKNIYYAADYLLELLILQSKSLPEFNLLNKYLLDPVQSYDQKNGTELVKSVTSVVHMESLDEAARHLFVHVNTLRKRLKKVDELTGIDPLKGTGRLMWLTLLLRIE